LRPARRGLPKRAISEARRTRTERWSKGSSNRCAAGLPVACLGASTELTRTTSPVQGRGGPFDLPSKERPKSDPARVGHHHPAATPSSRAIVASRASRVQSLQGRARQEASRPRSRGSPLWRFSIHTFVSTSATGLPTR
jgi:hypothetical protein